MLLFHSIHSYQPNQIRNWMAISTQLTKKIPPYPYKYGRAYPIHSSPRTKHTLKDPSASQCSQRKQPLQLSLCFDVNIVVFGVLSCPNVQFGQFGIVGMIQFSITRNYLTSCRLSSRLLVGFILLNALTRGVGYYVQWSYTLQKQQPGGLLSHFGWRNSFRISLQILCVLYSKYVRISSGGRWGLSVTSSFFINLFLTPQLCACGIGRRYVSHFRYKEKTMPV